MFHTSRKSPLPFVFALAISPELTGCLPAAEAQKRARTPDGAYTAVLTTSERGNVGTGKASVMIVDHRNRTGSRDLRVFSGNGGLPVAVAWANARHLVISFCGARSYEVTSSILEGEAMKRTGQISELTIDVVTAPKTVLHGKSYC